MDCDLEALAGIYCLGPKSRSSSREKEISNCPQSSNQGYARCATGTYPDC